MISAESSESRPGHCASPRACFASLDTGGGQGTARLRGGWEDEEAAGQDAVLLTDLLTRRRGTAETQRGTGDIDRPRALVNETNRHAGDAKDALCAATTWPAS